MAASVPSYRRGDSSPAVADIRDRLVSAGLLPAADQEPPSQDYDEQVERAVRAFQQRRGLLVDGVVGPQTYRALDGARWRLGDRILRHTPGHLMVGDDVAALQARLLSLGFDCGRADGVLGQATAAALQDLQRGVGLTPDGTCGPATLRALAQLARSAGVGGDPHAMREADRVRSAGAALSGRMIVLDPGHGADAPGAQGHDLVEADVVLDLARRIEGRLMAVGVRTAMTRGAGHAPDDAERADLANTLDADLLLSLHCDAGSPGVAHGVATFYYGDARYGARSAMGQRLADLVQREVVARTDLLDCRTHAVTWELLRRTRMPAVRIEAGHLTHPGDAARLADPAFRDTLAEAVVAAVQRLYLVDEDDAATGTLRISDVMARSHKP